MASLLFPTIDGAAQRARLGDEARTITKRWTEAAFAEQYESLRESLRPGEDRTQRMETLFATTVRDLGLGAVVQLLPHESVELPADTFVRSTNVEDALWGLYSPQSELWTAAEIRALAASELPGQRLFALALMESRPALASLDVVAPLIETSVSAFEQYRALHVALRLVSALAAADRARLRSVLVRERERYIIAGSDRYDLSVEIENAIDAAGG